MFSRFQLRLCAKQKRIEAVNTDYNMDCLIGDRIVRFDSILNVVEKINHSDFAVISSGNNMICYYPQITKYIKEFEVSNVQFISVKIVIASVEYSIKMCSPYYSFYIVGNELNVEWVRYYFLKYKSISLSHDVRYQMTIIDDNVQFIVLSEDESVVLEKETYQVYRYANEDEEETEGEFIEPDVVLDRMIEIGEEINLEQIVEDYANMEEKTIIGEEIELERLVNEYDNIIMEETEIIG